MANKFGLGSIMARIGADTTNFDEGMENVQKQIDSISGAFSKANLGLGGLAAGLGAASVGGAKGIGDLIKTAAEYEDTMNRVQASTGMTDEQALKAGKQVRELFRKGLGETYGEIGSAYSLVNSLFPNTSEDKKAITERVLQIAKTFDLGAEEVANSLARMTVGFQVPFKEAADGLVKTLQVSGGQYSHVLDAFTEYSEDYRLSGSKIGDVIADIQYGMTDGASYQVDKIADLTREIMDRTKDLTPDMLQSLMVLYSDELQSGEITMNEIIDNLKARDKRTLEQTQDIIKKIGEVEDGFTRRNMMEVFGGSIATDMGETFFINYGKRIGMFIESTGSAEKAWNDFTKGSFEYNMLKMKNAWTDLKTTIGVQFLPAVIKAIQTITVSLNGINKFFRDNPMASKFVAGFMVLGTVLAGVLSATLAIIAVVRIAGPAIAKMFGIFTKGAGGGTAVAWRLYSVLFNIALFLEKAITWVARFGRLLLSPITLAVAAGIGLQKLLYNAINEFAGKGAANFFKMIMNPLVLLQDIFVGILNWFVSILPQGIQSFAQKVVNIVAYLTKLLTLPAQMLANIISGDTINPFKIMSEYKTDIENGTAGGDTWNFVFNGNVDKPNAQSTGYGLVQGVKTANNMR
ncbi:phage tail tape measure protein [Lysinibacillus sp. FSL K6-0075]|uniref:phage tail tape measure protein n=1 Tax=Lysinibacillus sp. FSL K6-0075 TaxID=2921415 RepID=UPI0031582D3A